MTIDHAAKPRASILVVCVGLALALAVSACGGSSKPAYCSDRAKLESSIKGITNLSLSSGITGLQNQFKTIETDAATLVISARSDFPTQTSAIQSAAGSLATAVKAVESNPSPSDITAVVSAAGNTVTAVQSFLNATKSKCT